MSAVVPCRLSSQEQSVGSFGTSPAGTEGSPGSFNAPAGVNREDRGITSATGRGAAGNGGSSAIQAVGGGWLSTALARESSGVWGPRVLTATAGVVPSRGADGVVVAGTVCFV